MSGPHAHSRFDMVDALYPERVARDAAPLLRGERVGHVGHAWHMGRSAALEIGLQWSRAGA